MTQLRVDPVYWNGATSTCQVSNQEPALVSAAVEFYQYPAWTGEAGFPLDWTESQEIPYLEARVYSTYRRGQPGSFVGAVALTVDFSFFATPERTYVSY